MHLRGFIIGIYRDSRSSECQIRCSYLRTKVQVKIELFLFAKCRNQVEENGQLRTPANLALNKNASTHGIGDRVNPSANLNVLNSVSNIQNILE